ILRALGRPEGASPYGVLDMAGGVWEWTQGRLEPGRAYRVIRGGSTADGRDQLLTYRRQGAPPGGADFGALTHLGFRCVKPAGPEPPPGPELVGAADYEAAISAAARRGRYDRAEGFARHLLGLNPRSVVGNAWLG